MTLVEKKRQLLSALAARRRWEEAGKLPSGYENGEQLYYDHYHFGVKPTSNDTWLFSIQTYDSPDGDEWWHGEFRVLPGGVDVEIVNDRYESN